MPKMMNKNSYPVEHNGLPGFPSRFRVPRWRHNWYGKCEDHLRPKPARVWAPVTGDEGDYCREVLARDPCAYCGGPVEVIDHIVPRASAGDNDATNLTGACTPCNQFKSGKSMLLFLATRADPDERIENRVSLAEYRYKRALGESVVEIGTRAWSRGVDEAQRALTAAQAEAQRHRRWAKGF